MLTVDIQKALKAKGFDPGPADGVRGALTVGAIIAFQRANGLVADGLVGPQTAGKLFDGAPPARESFVPQTQPWMIEAFALLGLKEDVSAKSNPIIIGWAKALKINLSDDETPWCGLFVAHCVGSQLPSEPRPANPLGARQWAKFGKPSQPQPGAVMVFWRGSKAGGLGHVAFYVGEDGSAYHVVGGNQSNRVSVTRMPKARFLEARWPTSVPDPQAGPRLVTAAGALSTNEA